MCVPWAALSPFSRLSLALFVSAPAIRGSVELLFAIVVCLLVPAATCDNEAMLDSMRNDGGG
jgi:hypothetical protein